MKKNGGTGTRPYICIACGMTFRTESGLNGHGNYHVSVKKLVKERCPCGVCGEVFNSETISEHILVHGDEWPVRCDLCTARFTQKIYRDCHRNTYHSKDKNITCTICSVKFKSKPSQVEHIRSQHKVIHRRHKCTDCKNKYTRKYDLRLHIRKKHVQIEDQEDDSNQRIIFLKEEFRITDDELETDNPTERNQITDIGIKEEVKEDELLHPTIEFVQFKNELIETSDILINEGPNHSENIFPSEREDIIRPVLGTDNLDATDIKKEGSNETSTIKKTESLLLPITIKSIQDIQRRSKYSCCYCDKTFSSSTRAKEHKYMHTGEKPYHCGYCDKRFRYATHYSTHLKVHTNGVKLYQCDICNKNLSSRKRIKGHMRLHSNERPYICNDCGKGFRYSTQLNVHLSSHENTRKLRKLFQCHVCSKSLTSKHGLTIHIRLHTNERPYACELCGSLEISSDQLNDHKRMYHGANEGRVQKPFTHFCTICDKKYRSIVALKFHQKKHDEIRNFSCTECGDKFKLLKDLRVHKSEIHFEKN